jgi:hypothetical protein
MNKLDEETDDFSLPFILGVGSYSVFNDSKPNPKYKKKNPIGFIRPQVKDVRSKSSDATPPKRERAPQKGANSKGKSGKRTTRPVRPQPKTRKTGK